MGCFDAGLDLKLCNCVIGLQSYANHVSCVRLSKRVVCQHAVISLACSYLGGDDG